MRNQQRGAEPGGRHRSEPGNLPPRLPWRERPRDAVATWGVRSWLMLIVLFLSFFWGGIRLLSSSGAGLIAGFFLVVGGCALAAVVVLHLRRPVSDRPHLPWWRY